VGTRVRGTAHADGTYVDEINKTNKLGMGGEVAEEYGALVKHLWSGKYTSVAPRDLKVR
jgi:hypothetical protein